ncbi:MAG: leucine-rich repeat domain-containing protein [Promethearchaeota archaeon]
MKKIITPQRIKNDFLAGDLDKEKAAELLISLVENSEDTEIRVSGIKALEILEFQGEKLFNTLENYLISDEAAILRATAAEYIILNFMDQGITPLNWVLQHDKSPLVFKVFFNLMHRFNNDQYQSILKMLNLWKKNFASTIGIVPEESIFFLDLEALFAEDERNYEIDTKGYQTFQRIADFKGREPWLVINKKHVESLNFNYYKWKFLRDNITLTPSFLKLVDLEFYINSIKQYSNTRILVSTIPESIGSLSYLKRLNLSKNGLMNIPYSLKKLTLLKELDLSYNNLEEIPPVLTSLTSLEILNLKHNKIQRIPDTFWKYLNSVKTFYI